DVASGEEGQIFVQETGTVNALALSPDRKTLASGSFAGSVTVRDLTGATAPRVLKGDVQVNALAFSPDGKLLVAGYGDWNKPGGELRIWDTVTGALQRTLMTNAMVHSVSFHPSGKQFVSADRSGAISIWNPTAQPDSALIRQLRPPGIDTWLGIRQIAF